jgi:hypothetical protein
MNDTFTAVLWRVEGPGGWHFITVPEDRAPPVTAGWGRTPVRATVNGHAWDTSVWRDHGHRTLLAIPAAARRGCSIGDELTVSFGPR